MSKIFAKIENSAFFQRFILGVIIFSAVVVGLETSRSVMAQYSAVLHLLDNVIISIFVVEVLMKWAARWPRPWTYFQDGWNVFDFVIVVACLLPATNGAVTVVRLFRVLRVLRMVRAIPRLRLIVGSLLHSLPSMFYVSLLLAMLFYVYAVAGVFLFRENDPVHFGDLPTALVSLFRVVTLEDWTDIMYIQMYGSAEYVSFERDVAALMSGPDVVSRAMPITGALYFISFVVLGTMITLNLVIGVIVNSMSEAQKEVAEEKIHELMAHEHQPRTARIAALKKQLEKISEELDKLS